MHSRRRRSAYTVAAAVAFAVAAPLLTGCGQDTHPGAAAVVDGERISMAQLQSRVADVREAQRSAPQAEQMISGTGQLTRATLDGMIRDRVVARAAGEAGVDISRRDVQETRAELAEQAGGEKQLRSMLLQQQGLAPDGVERRVRMQVSVERIAEKEGIDPRTPQGNAELNRHLAATSAEMDIEVSPRFGTWDTEKAVLAGVKEPWVKDLAGAVHQGRQAGL